MEIEKGFRWENSCLWALLPGPELALLSPSEHPEKWIAYD